MTEKDQRAHLSRIHRTLPLPVAHVMVGCRWQNTRLHPIAVKIYHPTVHQFDLFPASLLTKRRLWQKTTHGLPANGCLLILQKVNTAQAQGVQRLRQAFHAQGRRVFILKIG